ncbi:hypothetical protein [Micromonospora sp. NPDC000668]|uniref:hypothetical protein n=1 Tax=Micromonospora sp. NPDC000668 TaxID=3364219 RepID=UPI0036834DCB
MTPFVEAGLMPLGRVAPVAGSLVKALIRTAIVDVWERSRASLFFNTSLYLHV